jgi:LuxR family maltose regulon positive regulatory protein
LASRAAPDHAGLQGHIAEQQIEQALATFVGNHRHLVEYLVTEVLDAQPKALQLFLLHTSVLSRLTGSLCDAVTGRTDSARLLETVERARLFLLPLGGTMPWYRYQTFFAEAMQHEARRRLGEDALRACLSRASAWYEQHGMLADAVDAAMAAGDGTRAAVLMERFIERQPLAEYYELYTLQRWLAQLPQAVLHAAPALCFAYANVLVFGSASDQLAPPILTQVEPLLERAEQGWRSSDNLPRLGEVLAFRALLAVRQGDIAQAAHLAQQALVQLPAVDRFAASRAICLGIVGGGGRGVASPRSLALRCAGGRAQAEHPGDPAAHGSGPAHRRARTSGPAAASGRACVDPCARRCTPLPG